MIGAAVGIANGKLLPDIIQAMFDCPEKFYDSKVIRILSPHGLYLKDIVYDEAKLDLTHEKNEIKKQSGP